MTLNVLHHLTLAYRPVWLSDGRLSAIRLRIHGIDLMPVHVPHCLHLLANERQEGSLPLRLAWQDPVLLNEALQLSGSPGLHNESATEPDTPLGHAAWQSPMEAVPMDRIVLHRLWVAIEKDASIEALQRLIYLDPVLTHGLLRWANDSQRAAGRSRLMSNVRQVLVMMGQSALQNWFAQQLLQASEDGRFRPWRIKLVLRAHMLSRLMNAGVQADLQAEMVELGLLSGLHMLLRQPLADLLTDLPLSEAMQQALLHKEGPYAQYLWLAQALEWGSPTGEPQDWWQWCEENGFLLEDINRSLVRLMGRFRLG